MFFEVILGSEAETFSIDNSFWRVRPEVLGVEKLRPAGELDPGSTRREWISHSTTERRAHFKIDARLAPGSYQLRLYVIGDERIRLAVFATEDDGENPMPLFECNHAGNEFSACEALKLPHPVRGLRVEIRMGGKFEFKEFVLRSLPPLWRVMRALYRAANLCARPFIRIGRIFWSFGIVTERDLQPSALLEAIPASDGKKWRSRGRDPFFTATKSISAGWVRVKARIDCERSAQSHFYFDAGQGFVADEAVFMSDASGEKEVVRYVKFPKPVRAVRFDPVDVPVEFTLAHFSAEPISDIRMWTDAFFLKIEDMRTRRNFRRSLTYGLKLLLKFNFREFREKLFPPEASVPQKAFEEWRVQHAITPERRASMRAELRTWQDAPSISIIMPVYNVPETYLRKAIDSVVAQIYQRWELCIADDRSTAAHIRPLLEEYSKKDPRIKVVYRQQNGHISAASNSALELATGEYVATLDNDDELTEHALFEVAKAIVADRSLDFIYSDEDKIDMTGRHIEPFFKPDWSPDYFLACMYTCHLGVYRTSLVREIGGYRSEFDTAQDYDLVLRVMEKTNHVRHISDILYHWRMLPSSTASGSEAKPKAHVTAQKALSEHLARSGENGRVEDGPSPGFHRIRFDIVGRPKVSIIIPSTCADKTIDGKRVNYLERCINSILEKSTWREFEIIVLDRHQMPAEMESRLNAQGVRRVTYDESFNWSRVNNLGARHASGSHLLLLNDDMEVITADWLESMLEFSQRDGVGAVGGKLFFPDGRIQHAGVIVKNCKPGHPYYCHPGASPGYFCSNIVHRNCIAVTGACLMTRKSVFDSIGGLNEEFPLNYNDVDYCLRLVASGHRIVFTPYSQLYHYESVTRPKGVEPAEVKRFESIWLKRFPDDPFSNPNLTFEKAAFLVKTSD